MAEEGSSAAPTFTTRLKGYLRESPFFCKIIELLLCVISLGLIIDPFNEKRNHWDPNHMGLIYTALCGYIMINAVLILCYLLGEKMPKKMGMIFSTLGAVMSLVAGILIIHHWEKYDDNNIIVQKEEQNIQQMIASGIFAIFAALTFVVDTYLSNRYE